MKDLAVIFEIAFTVGIAWVACICFIARYLRNAFPEPPKPQPKAPRLVTCRRAGCGWQYDPNVSLASMPELYCSEACEVEELERMAA
jgi:hypothetical protein